MLCPKLFTRDIQNIETASTGIDLIMDYGAKYDLTAAHDFPPLIMDKVSKVYPMAS